ncbi:MAG: leucyl/phenylalanyl-tRNA--protein transferase [Aestuariivita sp.]|nr:leucyl/phenylalanyl-tRNA--protein transferase [Aestuariivita sp.]
MHLSPTLIINAYSKGIFPMAASRNSDEINWFNPDPRGVLPLNAFRISRSLQRSIKKENYNIKVNECFHGTIDACADRPTTWINNEIKDVYVRLHKMGYAHSLEVWENDHLIGGIYGVALGAVFFGESMFSRRSNASKIALAYLIDRLNQSGFKLFEIQYLTSHLASLGAVEISQSLYYNLLNEALNLKTDFLQPSTPSAQELVHRITQIS